MKFAALILALLTCTVHTAETPWKAGAAKTIITPREPMWMAGYASRNKPAEGTAQELFAKALALEDAQGKRFVFVTLDLIGVPRTLRQALEKRVAAAHALPPEGLLLNASHTHCGPEFRVANKPGIFAEFGSAEKAEEYGAFLEGAVFKLIGEALAQLAPAQLSYHHARCGFAMNRRLPVEDTFRNSPNPEGPVDHDVPVLRVADAAGKLRAVLFGYACHNTTLSFYQWCGDYAGYAQEYLEAGNPEMIALFVTGCGGDQNPYPRGKIELAQFHGRALATAVEAALTTPPRRINGSLRAALADVEIDFAPPPPRTELEARTKSSDNYVASHARRLLDRLDRGETLPANYAAPVQVVRLGDSLTFIGLPGETVVDYALRLKRELTGAPLWVAGYCNDVMAYIPSRRVLEEGGYEGRDSMRYSHLPGPWAPTIEERIIGQVHALLRRLTP
jgi:hypothetical protein